MKFKSKFRAKFNHEIAGANFKIFAINFKAPAARAANTAKAEKFEILKFNASAANG
nr:hypothetical protein [uncultured Campylobacter sp.]